MKWQELFAKARGLHWGAHVLKPADLSAPPLERALIVSKSMYYFGPGRFQRGTANWRQAFWFLIFPQHFL